MKKMISLTAALFLCTMTLWTQNENVQPEDTTIYSFMDEMPKWTPGTRADKPVRAYYNIPITFWMSDADVCAIQSELQADQKQLDKKSKKKGK